MGVEKSDRGIEEKSVEGFILETGVRCLGRRLQDRRGHAEVETVFPMF